MMPQDLTYSLREDKDTIGESKDVLAGTLQEHTIDISDPSKMLEGNIMWIDAALEEMRDTFKERLPYVMVPTLGGNCYKWSPEFIYGVMVAFSTDALIQFTSEELAAFWHIVNFEEYHSHSAVQSNCNGLAIGCTVPDEFNRSYTVCKTGDITDKLCNDPLFNVINEEAWKSFDNLLMDLYWCRPIDDCGRNDGIFDIEPCPLKAP